MLHTYLVAFSLCIGLSQSVFFHMKETEERCFLEDVPEDTLVAGNYKLLASKDKHFERSKDLGVKVKVIDPYDQILLDRVYSSEGRFVFTAHRPGEYKICISSDSGAWFGGSQLRVHLDIQVGDHALNYQEIATKDRLNDIQLRVRQLLDQVQSIAKDQNYQRVREENFRKLSESTNRRVTWWSVAQLILLICIGFWQMRHLRAFFQAKKLV
uniref:Transmembrane emp24 domain-containing protein 4 n=1 Tax=Schistosoma japonicum TaxID=6182 RepID=C1L8G3_SCHJA|nr:Transmembrane emp24 domain-containing protein 4 precursor [Schistosoma japonicum]